jgi:hypothetical protein
MSFRSTGTMAAGTPTRPATLFDLGAERVRAENRDTVPYQRLCGHTADRPRSRRPAPAQHDLPLWPSDSRT